MWAIYIIASLVVLLLFILCVPVDITILLNTDQKPKFSAKLKWLFGLYSRELWVEKKHLNQEPQSRHKGLGFCEIVSILCTKGLFERLFRLIKRISNRIKVRELVADIKISLENPADLGLLFALLTPLNILIRNFSHYSIIVQPDFSDEIPLKGYAYSTASLQPILGIVPIFGFLLSKPGLMATKKLLSVKWKGKS